MAKKIINAFNGGEVDPKLHARTDVERYDNSCLRMENFVPIPFGGATRRPASKFIVETGTSEVKLVPFVINNTDKYVLAFSNTTLKILKNDVFLQIDGSDLEFDTPYLESELSDLSFAKSFDVLYIVHPNHSPRQLSRFTDTTWTFKEVVFTFPPLRDLNVTNTKIAYTESRSGFISTLKSSDNLFTADMVGIDIAIDTSRPVQKTGGSNAWTYDFDDNTLSYPTRAGGISTNPINVSFQSYTINTVQGDSDSTLLRSTDGGKTYTEVLTIGRNRGKTITSAQETDAFSYTSTAPEGADTFIKVQIERFTISPNNLAGVDIIPEQDYVTGIFRIKEYIDPKTVKAEIISSAIGSASQIDWFDLTSTIKPSYFTSDIYNENKTLYSNTSLIRQKGQLFWRNPDSANNHPNNDLRTLGEYRHRLPSRPDGEEVGVGSLFHDGALYYFRKNTLGSNDYLHLVKREITWSETDPYNHSETETVYDLDDLLITNSGDFSVKTFTTDTTLNSTISQLNILVKDDVFYIIGISLDSKINLFEITNDDFTTCKAVAINAYFPINERVRLDTFNARSLLSDPRNQRGCWLFSHEEDQVYIGFYGDAPDGTQEESNNGQSGSIQGSFTSNKLATVVSFPESLLSDYGSYFAVQNISTPAIANGEFYLYEREPHNGKSIYKKRYTNSSNDNVQIRYSGSRWELVNIVDNTVYSFVNSTADVPPASGWSDGTFTYYTEAPNRIIFDNYRALPNNTEGSLYTEIHAGFYDYHVFYNMRDVTIAWIKGGYTQTITNNSGSKEVIIMGGSVGGSSDAHSGTIGLAVELDKPKVQFSLVDTQGNVFYYNTNHPRMDQWVNFFGFIQNTGADIDDLQFIAYDGEYHYWMFWDSLHEIYGIKRAEASYGEKFYKFKNEFDVTEDVPYGNYSIQNVIEGDDVEEITIDNIANEIGSKNWRLSKFSEGFPTSVSFYENRLAFAGFENHPNKIILSQTNNFSSFETGSLDTDSLDIDIFSGSEDIIKSIIPQKSLIILSSSGEFTLGSVRDDFPITPSDFSVKRKSNYGCSNIEPILAKNNILYLMRQNTNLREWNFDFQSRDAKSNNLSYIAAHLLKSGVKDIAYQQQSDSIIWIVCCSTSMPYR